MVRRARKIAGKRQWTAGKAREVLKAWRASGLPLATFARELGLCAERVRRSGVRPHVSDSAASLVRVTSTLGQ